MKAGRKATGGRYKRPKKRKLTGRISQTRVVKLGNKKTKTLRTRGGSRKLVSFLGNTANVVSKGAQNTKGYAERRAKKSVIKNVIETPSNTFLARQNILVKGAIIETELGKVKITNRPSQEGNIQAVLIE